MGDVTHLMQAEYAHGLPCGVLTSDVKGAVLAANDTLAGWLGYTLDELRSRRVGELLAVGSRLFHQTHLAPLLQMQGSVSEVQLQLRHRDGHSVPVLTAIVRATHENEGVMYQYALMLSADRRKYEEELLGARQRAESALAERREALESLRRTEAELRKANLQLRDSDARKDEFLAVLGHELRNPLTPLRSGLDLLGMRKYDDPVLQRTLGVFDRQVTHMTRLVEDLMDVARIGKGKLPLHRELVRVSELVQRAAELSAPLFAKAGQALHQVAEDDCIIDGDMVRLTQVLVNLLNNASKYTAQGGTVWITYGRDGSGVRVTVRDTGIGLEAERLDQVFDMFSQVETAMERAQGGVGIGLGLVKGLVQLHGGTVRAESKGLGHGSQFIVQLPGVGPVPSPTA